MAAGCPKIDGAFSRGLSPSELTSMYLIRRAFALVHLADDQLVLAGRQEQHEFRRFVGVGVVVLRRENRRVWIVGVEVMAGRVENVDVVVGLDLADVERLVPLERDRVATEDRRERLRDADAAVEVAEVVETSGRHTEGRQAVEIQILLPGRDELSRLRQRHGIVEVFVGLEAVVAGGRKVRRPVGGNP